MEMFDCFCRCFEKGYESSGDEVEDKSAIKLSYVGKAAYNELRRHFNHYHHESWNVTSGVVVGDLHQTPLRGWLRDTEYPPDNHSDWFPKKLAEIMKRTEAWCDLMSLGPPDGLFFTEIKDALEEIARNSEGKEKPVIVRMMFSNQPGMPMNCNSFIKKITKEISKDANIQLWVGAWRRGSSWNHAKIIAVDGQYLSTGGHNLWDRHYLKHNPVHDLSLELEGRCAHDGHLYANIQWDFIQRKQQTYCGKFVDKIIPDGMPLIAKTRVTISEFPIGKASEFAPLYEKSIMPRRDPIEGEVPIITMGRYGAIYDFGHRPSDNAFLALLRSARSTIKLAIQDLGPVCIPKTTISLPGLTWPHDVLSVLAQVIWNKGVIVEIAQSNPGSIPGGLGITQAQYGNGWSCVDVAAEIIKAIQKQVPKATDAQLRLKVSENLHVCFIREARGNKYEDGSTMGMHAKHFIIDDRCAYVGSQNLYMCDLAEWGVVVDDMKTTKKMLEEYWDPMWKVSYVETDCDVDKVMDGLKIDRDGERIGLLRTGSQRLHLLEAQRMQSGFRIDEEESITSKNDR